MMDATSTRAAADGRAVTAPFAGESTRISAVKILSWSLAVFVASLMLFLWGIGRYRDVIFDESWYVPAARKLLETGEMLRQEHPPLGKLLIAAGMAAFGDNPFGWRIAAAVFGSLTIVATFFWALALFRNLAAAVWVAAITLFDQAVYVQARVAMLDSFLIAFCTLALALLTFSYTEKRQGRSFAYALAMGASLGLAGACKWSGFFLLFGIAAIYLLVIILRGWGASFSNPRETDFYGANCWTRMSPLQALTALALMPFAAYSLTYLQQMIHAGSPYEFVASHVKMHEIMSGNPGTHPYSSLWHQWPVMTRPVWYLFHIEGGDASKWTVDNPARAIIGLANPFVVGLGELAICAALMRWLRWRETAGMIVSVGFFAQWLPWLINPKGLEFSFYFFPSVVCVGPAIGALVFRKGDYRPGLAAYAVLASAGAMFLYFLPILSAQFGVSPEAYKARIWIESWR